MSFSANSSSKYSLSKWLISLVIPLNFATPWSSWTTNEFISKNPQFNGKSIDIEVSNNYILGNNIGIAVKDSSIVNSKNNTRVTIKAHTS